jgi:(p)ppGpp synthase/HD superfamily hydrolase
VLPGHVITGGVVSCTETLNVHWALLLAASSAVHVTVVEPELNVDPDVGVHVTDDTPTLSVAVASVYVTTAVVLPLSGCCATSAGHEITGLMLSRTTTLNVHVDDKPALSNDVHDTGVVVATSNWEPDATVHVVLTTPEPSVAVGVGLYTTVA